MSAGTGALLGAVGGTGVLLIAVRVRAMGRPTLEDRVVPYLGRTTGIASSGSPDASVSRLFRPAVTAAGKRLDLVLGGRTSLARRLERAGSSLTVDQLRLEQVAWGAGGFGSALAFMLLLLTSGVGVSVPAALVLCVAAGASGVLAREQLLNHHVRQRTERVAAEFAPVAELLALAVAAGEGVAGAIARVSRTCTGELALELRRALDDTRTGRSLTDALRDLAIRVDVTSVSRFVDGVVVAIERGTPLADVLRAQAADARELRRRELMETAGRREIAMLVPVVFLILPVTVVFALFPGFYGLSLSVP